VTTSPFHHNPRGSMSPQRRARIFATRGGVCGNQERGNDDWGCGRKIRGQDWQVEHDPALELGGIDTDAQCFVVCSWCVKGKDASDHGKAAKNRAVYTSIVVPRKYRTKGRPMPGSKASGIKKRMDGTVVRR
jgi:hypothetical protein